MERTKKTKEYAAFISYSRKDKEIAIWLHKQLENYEYPAKIIRNDFKPPHSKYVRPVFLDLTDLEASERSFTEDIRHALENTKYLILLCSKNSALSVFVEKEVKYFLKAHDNDYSRIVTLFVDQVDDCIPPVILDTPIMTRHFPIVTTSLRKNSEPNICAFYQILAFILGTDFSYLYDRYEHYAQLKKRQFNIYIAILVSMAVVALALMVFALYKRDKLIEFERKVYPHSIVYGYTENYLKPVIKYFKENNNFDFKILVLLPTNSKEIEDHQNRFMDIKKEIAFELQVDSLYRISLPTDMKRESHVFKIADDDECLANIFIDFATTTTSFKKVADYKRTNEAYEDMDIDDMVKDYARTFIKDTNYELNKDSTYVEFYTSSTDLIDGLKHHKKKNHK